MDHSVRRHEAFGADIDYAMPGEALYGAAPEGEAGPAQRRYSPAECVGARKTVRAGNPDLEKVSTSYAERHNVTMRMSMRRFTRLTNAFSKKLANHEHSLTTYFVYYNFVRIHKSLHVTPAMAAGVSDRLWTIEDMLRMADEYLECRRRLARVLSTDKTRHDWRRSN